MIYLSDSGLKLNKTLLLGKLNEDSPLIDDQLVIRIVFLYANIDILPRRNFIKIIMKPNIFAYFSLLLSLTFEILQYRLKAVFYFLITYHIKIFVSFKVKIKNYYIIKHFV